MDVAKDLYQKTSGALKTTAEKTQSVLGGLGSSLSAKFGDLKNTVAFKSFEEKLESAVNTVKTSMGTSRSASASSFDEALKESEHTHSPAQQSSAMSIPEDRTAP